LKLHKETKMRIVNRHRTGLFLVVTTVIVALSLVLAVSVSRELKASPAEPLQEDLTGTWTSENSGTYYVRQVGTTVWWVGQSRDGGNSYTNVFNGSRNGDQITGFWADVPAGKNTGSGSLTLSISRAGANFELRKVKDTGGFGESIWKKRVPPPPPGFCTISGRVLDDRPQYQTQIRLVRPDGSATSFSMRTINREYRFTNVPEGTYQVRGKGNYSNGLGIFSEESSLVTCERDERVILNFAIRSFEG
jgi:hypothetical protein